MSVTITTAQMHPSGAVYLEATFKGLFSTLLMLEARMSHRAQPELLHTEPSI